MKSTLRCIHCGEGYVYQGDHFGELRAWDWYKQHFDTHPACREARDNPFKKFNEVAKEAFDNIFIKPLFEERNDDA